MILQTLTDIALPDYLIRLLRSYFCNRSVTCNGVTRLLERGCPQGSVLGPSLWNILYNIVETLNRDNKAICYVDDTHIILSSDTEQEIRRLDEQTLARVEELYRNRGSTLSVNKTRFLLFYDVTHRLRQLAGYEQPSWTFHGHIWPYSRACPTVKIPRCYS